MMLTTDSSGDLKVYFDARTAFTGTTDADGAGDAVVRSATANPSYQLATTLFTSALGADADDDAVYKAGRAALLAQIPIGGT